MNIGEILTKAWQIIWKHKVLWIFGILAGCASGGGSGNGITYTFNSGDFNGNWQPFYFDSFAEFLPWLFLILFVVLVLVVLVIFLGTVGRIGLIQGAQQADGGKTRLGFRELFSGSLPYFWRVFALNLLVGILTALAVFAIFLFIIFGTVLTLGIGLLCFIPLICLMIPLGWLVTVWLEQANIAIVVEDLGITEGLQRGWQVFRNHFAQIIGMALVLLVVNLVAGLLIAAPFLFFIVPAIWAAAAGTETVFWTSLVISIICLVMLIPVIVTLFGILTAFTKTTWTLTFLRLTGQTPSVVTDQPDEPVSELEPVETETEEAGEDSDEWLVEETPPETDEFEAESSNDEEPA